MGPAVTVLQLDTAFPRVPGDVGCPETFDGAAEILIVPGATVGTIVRDRPDQIDIAPFEAALARAKGQVIATSCGFLSYWQDHLAARSPVPFVSSALVALRHLSRAYRPGEILIVTFDADSLSPLHFGEHAAYADGVIGLPPSMHLRQVIAGNRPELDPAKASRELVEFLAPRKRPEHRHLLLECTNLPPYKSALRATLDLPVSDILTEMEMTRPGTVAPVKKSGARHRLRPE